MGASLPPTVTLDRCSVTLHRCICYITPLSMLRYTVVYDVPQGGARRHWAPSTYLQADATPLYITPFQYTAGEGASLMGEDALLAGVGAWQWGFWSDWWEARAQPCHIRRLLLPLRVDTYLPTGRGAPVADGRRRSAGRAGHPAAARDAGSAAQGDGGRLAQANTSLL